MNKIFKSLIICSVLLTAAVGCSDMFREEIYDIHEELDKINARLDELSKELNTNVSSLQTIIEALQQKDYVDKITPIMEGGVEIGYEIIFTQSGSVKIYHGEKGDEGHSPVVGMKQEQDGRWYWTIDGEWMLDDNKNKVLAIAEDGKDGLTPKFEVRDGDWYISYDDGETWKYYAQATGDKGEQGDKGDSMFSSVEHNDQYVTLVLADGVTTIKLPTWASHQLLVDEIARINNNIDALQKAVAALEKNDYVTKVTPIEGEDGVTLGYTLSFAFTGDVSIYHGQDGEDGHNPVVAAKQDTDGNWYWTVDDQWLLDENGAKIRTTGDDGLTPKFKIEDGKWYIRYNEDQEWKEYGQATGDKGDQGETGNAGDSVFAKDGIDVSNPDYIELTLANGTKIQIPTLAKVVALENRVNQLNENLISLQTIVAGLQNNDYVTSISDIIDPQTNEKIGFTLHFSKSGNVDIYHGEDGKDGATPTVTISEDGYWVINGVKQSVKALGTDGANGTTPKFKIEGGKWFVSYDNGGKWEEAGQATGDQGPEGPQGPQGPEGVGGTAGDTLFKSITEEYATDEKGNVIKDFLGRPTVAYIVITLNDSDEDDTNNPTYKIPTDYVIGDLQKQIDAITNDIKTIQTVLNAVQNAEYIKECTPLYDGLVHIGYEIVFAKFTVENGEQTRKTTIYNGTDGANGTVIGALYDEATQTWYWTLDDEPLKDAAGNLVPLQGKDGAAGVTPQMQINATTNFWEVSYDNGQNWVSTEVKATGPQGESGAAGTSAESYIQDVKQEGDYYIFYVKDGSTISVPTAQAFETLAKKVAALEESSASISSILGVLNGMKFVKSNERFENETGTGYKLVLVTFDPATMAQTEEICYVYDGRNGAAGEAGKTPVVGLRQDANGDYYWTLDGEDLLVDGKPVKANGADGQPGAAGAAGPVPTFRIDADGYLWVKIGDAEEQNLGKVVGATGSAGTAGSNASIDVTEEENGKITITFKNDGQSTGSITVPSWNAFLELQAQVNEMNGNISSLQASVDALLGHDCVIAVVEDKKDGEVVGYTLTFSKSGDKYISLGKDGADGKPGAPGTPGTDGHTPVIGVAAEDGVLYWTVDSEWLKDEAGNKVPVTGATGATGSAGADGKTPKFKIVDGDWYYSYEKENTADNDIEGWTYAGRATGSTGATGGSGDSFFTGVNAVGADQVTEVGSAEAYYIKIDLVGGASYLIPTQKTTDAINALLTSANSNIEAIQASVAALQDNDYVTKVEEYKENGVALGYKIYFSKGTEAIIYHGAKGDQGDKGADGVTPTVSINEQGYWVINGEVTEVKAAGDKGDTGITPEFKIDSYTDAEGTVYTAYWFVKYGENAEWEPLHQALGPQGPHGEQGPVGPEGPVGPQGPAGVTGDAFIHSITPLGKDGVTTDGVTFANAWYIRIILNDTTETLEDNPTYVLPTKKVTDELYVLVETLNQNVESLSTIVNALDARQYLISYGPYEADGKKGYRLTLSDGPDEGNEEDVIYIWHGTNGENGTTPSVSVKKDEDDKLYWAVDGEFLLDADGKKVPATGEKGEQGDQGIQGEAAKTPEFKIGSWEIDSTTYTDCWLVSYDHGQTWNPVLGADGKPFSAKGETGGQGDSFFQSVTTEEVEGKITYLVLTTADGVQHKIPTQYTFKLLEERVSSLEGDVDALQTAVAEIRTAISDLSTALNNLTAGAMTKEEFEAWKAEARFVGGVSKTGDDWTITVVDGNNAVKSTETLTVEHPVTVYEKDGSYYWQIGSEKTNEPVISKPHFKSDVDGNLLYTFDDPDSADAVWNTIESPAQVAKTDIVFTDKDPSEYTSESESVSAADALWVGIRYSESDIIWMPTYKNYQTLAARVTALEESVETLVALLQSNSTYVSAIETTENGFKATVVTYSLKNVDGKLTYEVVKSEDVTYNESSVSVVKKEDGKWYWVVDGVETVLMDTGFIPQIYTAEDGLIYISTDPKAVTTDLTKGWVKIDPTDDQEIKNATYTETTDGYTITFADGTSISVPSLKAFNDLVTSVNDLNDSVGSLKTLVSGKMFIKAVNKDWTDSETGRTGVEITYVQVDDDLKLSDEQKMYLYDGTKGETHVVGLRAGDPSNGELESDWYWTLDGADLLVDGKPVKANGADGAPGQPGANAPVPTFRLENGNLLVKVGDEEKNLGNIVGPQGPQGPQGPAGADALKKVEDKGTYYEVIYSDDTTIKVPKYYASPTIEFSTETLDLETNESATLTCTITGSFTSEPEFYTTCEGYFTSAIIGDPEVSGNAYTYRIKVVRTTAMANTDLVGKLTVYVSYFNETTKMKQVALTATTPSVEVKSIVVPADKEDLTFTFSNLTVNSGELTTKFESDGQDISWIKKGSKSTENGTFAQAFDLAINTTGEDRECTVNFYNASGQLVDHRIIRQQPLSAINLAAVDPNAADPDANIDPANCYIISKPGRYKIPLVEGNSSTPVVCDDPIKSPSSATAFSIDGTDADNNPIRILAKSGNYLYFDVCPELTADNKLQRDPETFEPIYSTEVTSGNSLLAVKNGTSTSWSWHLWFSPNYTVLGTNIGEVTYQEMPDGKDDMMDRNLGADVSGLTSIVPGSATGLYYKYGYRSPFYNGSYYGIATDADGLTWISSDADNKKHKMDPCPPGYRVPESSEWTSRGSHSLLTSSYEYWDNVLYPYSEYLLADGSQNENDPEYLPFQEGYKFNSVGREQGTIPTKVFILNVDIPQLAEDEFTINDMDIRTSVDEGRLWSNSGYLYYKHNSLNVSEVFESGVDALRERLQIRAYSQRRRVVKEYKVNITSLSQARELVNQIRSGQITNALLESFAVWDEYKPVENPHMTENDVDALLGKLILLDSENIDVTTSGTVESISNTEGYQVRCMKE